MINITYHGRLGNNITQYVVGRLLAEKYKTPLKTPSSRLYNSDVTGDPNVSLDYVDWSSIIKPMTKYTEVKTLTKKYILDYETNILFNNGWDHNRSDVVDYKQVLFDTYENFSNTEWWVDGYFQREDILCGCRQDILNMFRPCVEHESPDKIFVHYRLGDLIWSEQNDYSDIGQKPIDHEYYIRSIESCDFSGGFLTTDSPEDARVKDLLNRYNLQLYQSDPVTTINFARRFKQLVLSHGQMSYWMAYLAENSKVTVPFAYPVHDKTQNIYKYIYEKD